MKMWTVRLRLRDRGRGAEIEAMSDDVPAGEIEIRGADDGNRVTLNVRQRDARGRFVASAHHTRDRAEEALEDAETLAGAAAAAGGEAEIGVTVEAEEPRA